MGDPHVLATHPRAREGVESVESMVCPHSFARAGAGAFVGTLWLVRDTSACAFAEAFDGELVGGSTLGAALKVARQRTQISFGDPTWLAYAAYGDPDAVLQREA